jgi:hypothetical protein
LQDCRLTGRGSYIVPGNILFWSGLVVSLAIGFLYFRDLGDVSQLFIRVKRKNMLRFIRNEYRLLAIGLSGLAVTTIVHFGFDSGPRIIWWAAVLLCALLYGFPYIWVHVGLRNQKDSARYYAIEEARRSPEPEGFRALLRHRGGKRVCQPFQPGHRDRE